MGRMACKELKKDPPSRQLCPIPNCLMASHGLVFSVGAVLLGVRSDVLQCPQDPGGDGVRCGEVLALRLEAVLVSDVTQCYGGSVGDGVTVGSLNSDHSARLVQLLQLAVLLCLYTIPSLVAEDVRAVRIGPVRGVRDDRDRRGVVHGCGVRRHREQGEEGASLQQNFLLQGHAHEPSILILMTVSSGCRAY